ncbi:TIR domain-containing protein [Clostridium grantii]|uniref:Ig-like domain (Group 2) n=1 Tax=Clostridium grantii DSM 8605 TaxID=1121316 RepID=A0A1M5R125_9CLOT|nr:TIR domain-containing protein [Clostridium grantii]SHH19868.1 Ig-like domain (group 2) [Clostridium grantii DSM 8605]
MDYDVFISYSTKDKKIAETVCSTLELDNVKCWIAPRDILPGTNYGEAIVEAIEKCRIMVLIFSDNANKSRHVTNELERALNYNKIIVPFKIEDVVPCKKIEYFLSASQWIEALANPIKSKIVELSTIIRRILNEGGEVEGNSKNPSKVTSKINENRKNIKNTNNNFLAIALKHLKKFGDKNKKKKIIIGGCILIGVIFIGTIIGYVNDSSLDEAVSVDKEVLTTTNSNNNNKSNTDTSTEKEPIKEPILVENATISDVELLVYTGKEYKLNVIIIPNNADNKNIIWKSDDVNIAEVDSEGVVVGRNLGTASITATTEDGNIDMVCHVTVEKGSLLQNLNFIETNRKNLHAGKEILLSQKYIYYNQNGKLYRSMYDGSEKILLTDILEKDSEIAVLDKYIYFISVKENEYYFYRILSDGSKQAEVITSLKSIGSFLGDKYNSGHGDPIIRYSKKDFDFSVFRDKVYFKYTNLYQYDRLYDYCENRWHIAYYDPDNGEIKSEISMSIDKLQEDSTEFNYFVETWLGSGCLFYTYTQNNGLFKKEIGREEKLLSNVVPTNILSDEENVYYIDQDYSSLNRMSLEGTLNEKLYDNVTYFTMTDFDEILFVSGENIYKVDKNFKTQPIKIGDGVEKFIYAGDYLYYYLPDLSIKRINIETSEEQIITEGIKE